MTILDAGTPEEVPTGLLRADTIGRAGSLLRLAPVLRKHPWGFGLTVASATGHQGFLIDGVAVAASLMIDIRGDVFDGLEQRIRVAGVREYSLLRPLLIFHPLTLLLHIFCNSLHPLEA